MAKIKKLVIEYNEEENELISRTDLYGQTYYTLKPLKRYCKCCGIIMKDFQKYRVVTDKEIGIVSTKDEYLVCKSCSNPTQRELIKLILNK